MNDIIIKNKICKVISLFHHSTGILTVGYDNYHNEVAQEGISDEASYTLSKQVREKVLEKVQEKNIKAIFMYKTTDSFLYIISFLFSDNERIGYTVSGPVILLNNNLAQSGQNYQKKDNIKKVTTKELDSHRSLLSILSDTTHQHTGLVEHHTIVLEGIPKIDLIDITQAYKNYDYINIMSLLLNAFRDNDINQVELHLQSLFNSFIVSKNGKISIEFIKYYIVLFYTFLLLTSIENGVDLEINAYTTNNFLQHIYDSRSYDSLTEYARLYFTHFLKLRKKRDKLISYSRYIRKAIMFMKQNMSDDISLKKTANTLKISTRYLSRLFKTETGLTFNEYLTSLRMIRAKFLLNQTNRSILDISLLVGIKNQAYFSTLFKKNIGTSPMNYRNQNNIIY